MKIKTPTPSPLGLEDYIECALWSSYDNDGYYPLDSGEYELSEDARNTMAIELQDFLDLIEGILEEREWPKIPSDQQIAHDFWLTRNGHGAGFWDRGLGDLGDKLTEASKSYGSSDLYVGDDNLIYLY